MSAINSALEQNRLTRRLKGELAELRERFSRLTPREKEVLPLVVSGLLNKQAATELGISEITIRIHRGRIMEKMQAASLAELVRLAAILEVPMTYSRRQKYD
jgi:FixJ family two-component response regulator